MLLHMFQGLTTQLHKETSGLWGGGEGEADLSRGERPRGRPGEVELENRGARTNARRLEQWICDLGKPPWRVGKASEANRARMNERSAMSSQRRSRGITFTSISRLGTGEDRKAPDARWRAWF